MIKVLIKKDEILINGHAKYDVYGKDIVCSAVSSIVTTTINAIFKFKNTIEVEDNNYLKIKILEHDNITDTLINNMIDLLKEIENQYQKNIQITEEGD